MTKKTSGDGRPSPHDERGGSLRLWISMATVFFILLMAGMGQWDFALAGLVGLVMGSGLSALFGR